MTIKSVLPLLALSLSACAQAPNPQPIPVLAEIHRCPAYPLPPAELLKVPTKTNFLPATR